MSPAAARAWVTIFRDVAITFVAIFMLIFETIWKKEPNIYIVGAGLTLLGIPPALRLDWFVREKGE